MAKAWRYVRNLVNAVDRVGAALIGWSGRKTISAECHGHPCMFCRFVCWLFHKWDKRHCQEAADRESTI